MQNQLTTQFPQRLLLLGLLFTLLLFTVSRSCEGVAAVTPGSGGSVQVDPTPSPGSDGRAGAGITTLALSQAPKHVRQLITYLKNAKNLKPPKGFKGGKIFRNREGNLPGGRTYYEFDVHPSGPGVARGAERVVVDEGKQLFYYTRDHYNTFIKLQ